MKILVIDDDESKRNRIMEAIQATGISCKHCGIAVSVAEASQKCSKSKYDIVILDLQLPLITGGEPKQDGGLQFLNNMLRQSSLKRPCSLVGLTAYETAHRDCKDTFERECYTLIKYDATSTDWMMQLTAAIAQASAVRGGSRLALAKYPNSFLSFVNIVIALLSFIAVLSALYFPIAVTPTSRTVLFFICACLCAILFGAHAKAHCSLKLPGFCLTTSGALAIFMGVLVLLHRLTTSSICIGVYNVIGSKGEPAQLLAEACSSTIGGTGSPSQLFINGSNLLIVFPHGEEATAVRLLSVDQQDTFSGKLRYTPGISQTVRLSSSKSE